MKFWGQTLETTNHQILRSVPNLNRSAHTQILPYKYIDFLFDPELLNI